MSSSIILEIIFQPFNILEQSGFTKSKMVPNIQYKKYCLRAASRVTEQLKKQDPKNLENKSKMSKLDRDGGQCQVLVAKMPKITQKQLPKFSAPIQSCLISLPSSKCHVQIVTNLRIEPQKIDDEIYQINRTYVQ